MGAAGIGATVMLAVQIIAGVGVEACLLASSRLERRQRCLSTTVRWRYIEHLVVSDVSILKVVIGARLERTQSPYNLSFIRILGWGLFLEQSRFLTREPLASNSRFAFRIASANVSEGGWFQRGLGVAGVVGVSNVGRLPVFNERRLVGADRLQRRIISFLFLSFIWFLVGLNRS